MQEKKRKVKRKGGRERREGRRKERRGGRKEGSISFDLLRTYKQIQL